MFAAVVAAIDLNAPGWSRPANADDPAAEDSFAAVVDRAMEVVQGSRMLGPAIDLAPEAPPKISSLQVDDRGKREL
jgi:hypothetical protein